MIFSSIRWRLQIWHGALLAAMVAGLGITAQRFETAREMSRVDAELQTGIAQLVVAFPPQRGTPSRAPSPPGGAPPPPPGNSGPPPRLRESARPPRLNLDAKYYYALWNQDGSVQARSGNAPPGLAIPNHRSSDQAEGARMRGAAREYFRFSSSDRCIIVGRGIEPETAALRLHAWYLAGAGAAVLALGWLGGGWLTARAIRPIADISATAEKIAAGDLSKRITTSGFADELQKLAGVLNSTFSRLDAAFTQQGRFTADAAHELRTPVSVILMHTQNGLASDALGTEQREAFEACERAARRMKRLIEALLELARFDAGQESVKREPFDLATTARDCLELVRPLADARGIVLHGEIETAPCLGDSVRIAQVVTNLLSNAIEYNRERGEVRVKVRRQNGSTVLTIADNGAGISPENLPRIFERFHRADTSRSASGHTGLGLAICKAIVDAHGGSIEAASKPGEGTSVTVRLTAAA